MAPSPSCLSPRLSAFITLGSIGCHLKDETYLKQQLQQNTMDTGRSGCHGCQRVCWHSSYRIVYLPRVRVQCLQTTTGCEGIGMWPPGIMLANTQHLSTSNRSAFRRQLHCSILSSPFYQLLVKSERFYENFASLLLLAHWLYNFVAKAKKKKKKMQLKLACLSVVVWILQLRA